MAAINFQVTISDLAACGRYVATHNRMIRSQIVRAKSIATVICFVAVIGTVSLLGGQVQFFDVIISSITAVGIYFLSEYVMRKCYIRSFVQATSDGNRDFTRNMTVFLTDEGIESDSDLGSGTIMWSAIQAVGESEKHVFLQLPGVSYLVIPKSAFSDQQAMTAFVTTIQSHIQT